MATKRVSAMRLFHYNAVDLVATARAYKGIKAEMEELGAWDYYRQRVWPTIEVCLAMQRRGFPADDRAIDAYKTSLEHQLAESEQIVQDHFRKTHKIPENITALAGACLFTWLGILGHPDDKWVKKIRRRKAPLTKAEYDKIARHIDLNMDSPKQVTEWLANDLGLKLTKFTDGGQPSANVEALVSVYQRLRKRDREHEEALAALIHRSRLQTIYERYVNITPENGRVYPSIKPYGAETGRLAYADPPLQQIPKEARVMFKCQPGRVLVGLDYSQLEARIMSVLAGDMVDIHRYETGVDVHAETAKELFGYNDHDWEELPKEEKTRLRNVAKTFRYGIAYGGDPRTLKTKVFCPCKRCNRGKKSIKDDGGPIQLNRKTMTVASQRWFSKHPKVAMWQDSIRKQVRETRMLRTPFGRVRVFFSPDASREALNFPIQSSAADIINAAMVRLHERGVPLVLQLHDALYAEVPEERAMETAKIMKEEMERPVPELRDTVFPTEAEVGESWGAMRPIRI